MINTLLIKNRQNNLSTTITMKFKLLTQHFHEVYHTHKFTWIRSMNFIIQKSQKSQLTQKHLYS